MMFAPKTSLSGIHSARALLCLFILCFSSALSSSLKLHLRNFYVTISEISMERNDKGQGKIFDRFFLKKKKILVGCLE